MCHPNYLTSQPGLKTIYITHTNYQVMSPDGCINYQPFQGSKVDGTTSIMEMSRAAPSILTKAGVNSSEAPPVLKLY